jgi:hypothetical protein
LEKGTLLVSKDSQWRNRILREAWTFFNKRKMIKLLKNKEIMDGMRFKGI